MSRSNSNKPIPGECAEAGQGIDMQQSEEHYLKQELYELMRKDSGIFEFLQKGLLDGISFWDLENRDHEWISPEVWRLFGYLPEEKQHLASEWQAMTWWKLAGSALRRQRLTRPTSSTRKIWC